MIFLISAGVGPDIVFAQNKDTKVAAFNGWDNGAENLVRGDGFKHDLNRQGVMLFFMVGEKPLLKRLGKPGAFAAINNRNLLVFLEHEIGLLFVILAQGKRKKNSISPSRI